MNYEEIAKTLELNNITDRNYSIFKTSAIEGYGLKEALNWMIDNIKK